MRAIIRAVDASAVETVRLGDNAATYGVGPKKMTDGYAYIMPMRGYINLGFYQGAVLADPQRLLEGTGKGLRHVKIRSLAEANRPAVRALVAAALARRRSGATEPASEASRLAKAGRLATRTAQRRFPIELTAVRPSMLEPKTRCGRGPTHTIAACKPRRE